MKAVTARDLQKKLKGSTFRANLNRAAPGLGYKPRTISLLIDLRNSMEYDLKIYTSQRRLSWLL